MAFQVYTSNSIGAGVRVNLGTTDSVFIASGVTVSRTDDTGDLDFTVFGTGSSHRVDVAGTVLGTQIAIELGDDPTDTGNVVNITTSGVLRGFNWSSSGVRMAGIGNVLTNAGDIWALNSGVIMVPYGETASKITNSGTIGANNTGISRYNSAAANGTISLENSGTIFGKEASYNSGGFNAKDLVTNIGRMIGNVNLGGGDDVYDGASGRLAGAVNGDDGNDAIRGGVDDDEFNGGAGNDKLYGGVGNDTLNGGADKDLLDGGVGADTMSGGAGDDTYIIDNPGDKVTETAGEGTDLVQAAFTYTLGANVENLTLTGAAKINGTGNELANVLVGNAADNVLDGKAGADQMQGGNGNDTYVIDNVADKVVEKASEGTDLVKASVSITLSANVENLTLTGAANIAGAGNDLANIVKGNTGGNVLKGGAGNDTLMGEAGIDVINGGVGADKLYGGTGADTFVFASIAESTSTASGRDTIYDFSRTQKDKIDLKAIDASTKAGGNQAFTFIGAEKFHNKAGELRYEKMGGDTFVHGDVNGDGKADFSIMLDLSLTMSKTDFIL